MANNVFNNVADINKSCAKVLENNLVAVPSVNREYDDRFKDMPKAGNTINVRLPGSYSVRTGKVAVPQGYNDTYAPLSVQQYGVDVTFGSAELALNVDDFEANVLQPMMAPLANRIDRLVTSLFPSFHLATGTPGTAPTDLQYFLDAKAILSERAVPQDGRIAAIVNPRTEAKIVGGLKTLYNPDTDISRMYKEGTMGKLAGGMAFSMSQNMGSHTFGPLGGSPQGDDHHRRRRRHDHRYQGLDLRCRLAPRAGRHLHHRWCLRPQPRRKDQHGPAPAVPGHGSLLV